MSHPFEDKLFAFIGNPKRCSRREAREALNSVGGVTDDRILSFTEYVVSFEHDGKSKKYIKAVKDSNNGYLVLLDENQFFDILEGKSEPPVKPKHRSNISTIPGSDENKIKYEKSLQKILNQKRISNMVKYGTTMPDGSIAKIDLRPLDITRRILEMMKKQPNQYGFIINSTPHHNCNVCGKLAKVRFRVNNDSDYIKLCQDCYNDMMAEYLGIKLPGFIPEQFLCDDDTGKSYKFDIEFLIFATGKELTAKEKGKVKRRIQVHGELDADVGAMLQLLKKKIIKAINTVHIDEQGYIKNSIAEGYIAYNSKHNDYDVMIDGKPYTWEDLKKNISAREGWNIRIEFGDFNDVVE